MRSGKCRFFICMVIGAVCLAFVLWPLGKGGTQATQKTGAYNRPGKTDREEHRIELTGLSQEGIPTGCEAVSTVTVLQYYGVDISPYEFIDGYLPIQPFYMRGGLVYGADPNAAFAGDPYESGSLGCYAPVITEAVRVMVQDGYRGREKLSVKNLTGTSFQDLLNYVARDKPVLVWVTIGMKESYAGYRYCLEDGSLYTWRAGEHCMVLCGYDEEYYYLKDPLSNGETVSYDRNLVEQRYEEMGMQAVLIERD